MPLPETTDEPLRLIDGTLVYPDGRTDRPGVVGNFVEIPTHREAQKIIAQVRRKVSDLPEVPKTMNAIGAVLSYTLFGLDDEEIAIATGLSATQVGKLKMSDPYTQMYDGVARTILDSETDVVRELLAKNAKNAATVIVDAMHNGNRADRIAAAKDVLDRSGHRPADVVEHRHRVDGGLVIEIVKRDSTQGVPTIEMETSE